jgi:hypothetical protein
MHNRAMRRKLEDGEALDVRAIGKELEPGVFELSRFVDDVDYCDAKNEEWIWSIGRRLRDGVVLAATNARFYQNDEFECLWLR